MKKIINKYNEIFFGIYIFVIFLIVMSIFNGKMRFVMFATLIILYEYIIQLPYYIGKIRFYIDCKGCKYLKKTEYDAKCNVNNERQISLYRYANALVEATGDIDTAYAKFVSVDTDKMKQSYRLDYYQKYLTACINFNDMYTVGKLLNSVNKIEFEILSSQVDNTLALKLASKEKLELFLLKKSKKAKKLYDKVLANYNLGVFYFNNNMNDKSIKYLEYVINNGKDIYLVDRSKKILSGECKEPFIVFKNLMNSKKYVEYNINQFLLIFIFLLNVYINLRCHAFSYAGSLSNTTYLLILACYIAYFVSSMIFSLICYKKGYNCKKTVIITAILLYLFVVLGITFYIGYYIIKF